MGSSNESVLWRLTIYNLNDLSNGVIQHIIRLKGFESELLFAGNSAAISFELMQFTVNCSLRKWSLMIIWKNCTNIRLNEVQLFISGLRRFHLTIVKIWSWKIHFHPMYVYVNFTLKMQRTSKMFHVNKLSVSHKNNFRFDYVTNLLHSLIWKLLNQLPDIKVMQKYRFEVS